VKKSFKKHNKKKHLRRRKRTPKPSQNLSVALLKKDEGMPLAPSSAMPTIQETIRNMHKVRRFVLDCLNVDLKREQKRVELKARAPLKEWEIQELETDWGTIPGLDKPFLKQPGAEKFLLWLGLRPEWEVTEKELPDGHLEVVSAVKVLSKRTKEKVFDGPACSCSTMESNFRFRFVMIEENETPPTREEAEELVRKGLGKWKKARRWVRGQRLEPEWIWHRRYDNPNIHDERNKVRQMSQKRSLVKCVKNMGAMSELFAADPSEWDMTEEADEGSPYQDQDFTPEGNRIVDAKGFSLSGKPITKEAQQTEQTERARKVYEEKRQAMGEAGKGHPEWREGQAAPDKPLPPKKAEKASQPSQEAAKPPIPQTERKIWIRGVANSLDAAVAGYLDDPTMVQFLVDVSASSAIHEGKKWYRIPDQYVLGFRTLCEKLGLPIVEGR
jgi:hypothetical protein